MRLYQKAIGNEVGHVFPYFFVGTFIEAPSASSSAACLLLGFPYFFVGTFIEAGFRVRLKLAIKPFPYFFVGTFIEASYAEP